MKNRYFPLICLTLLVGCGEPENDTTAQGLVAEVEPDSVAQSAPQNKFGFAEAVEQGPDPFGSRLPPARMATFNISRDASGSTEPSMENTNSTPQHRIAYSYGFGFRISRDRIAELQSAHSLASALVV